MASKKPAAKKKTSGAASKKNTKTTKNTKNTKKKKESLIKEATPKEAFSSEVMGLVLVALGILMALYLYGVMPESGIGKWIYYIVFNAVGFVAYAIPPFFVVLGVLTIAGKNRAPAAGRVPVIVSLVLFVAAAIHLVNGISFAGVKEGATTAETVGNFFRSVGAYVSDCSDRALGILKNVSRGGGVLGGLICLILYLIGGQGLCSVVVVAGLVICLILLTSISVRTFPDILKGSFTSFLEKIDPDDEEDEEEESAPEKTVDDAAPRKKKHGLFVLQVTDGETEEKAARARREAESAYEDDGSEYPAEHLAAVNRGFNEEPSDDTLPMEEELTVTRFRPSETRKPAAAPAKAASIRPVTREAPKLFVSGEEDFLAAEPVKKAESAPAAPVFEGPRVIEHVSNAEAPVLFGETEKKTEPVLFEEEDKSSVKKEAAPLMFTSVNPDFTAPEAREDEEEEKEPEVSVFTSVADMRDSFVSKPYTAAEAAKEAEPEVAKPFVYHDEATGEALPVPTPVPDKYIPFPLESLKAPVRSFRKENANPDDTGREIVGILSDFGVEAEFLESSVGPVVTRYEFKPAAGVRVSKITSLANDIALALAATRVRIEAPIPNKAAFGIEVPNKTSASVVLREIIESPEFEQSSSPITMAMGKDIGGKIVVADLGKMPHMLIAGSTGSGKSVCINNLILSMVYKSAPEDLRLILVDPKQVELSVYAKLPHLLIPVVTDPKKASAALRWAVNEMTLRYQKFSQHGARDLKRYNSLQDDPKQKLPRIVVIIDELADLMMVAPDEVEESICRIAQLGRAAGMHLIVATQRPSSDVITGLIKANIPSRAAFAVSSSIDSRIILDATGAEKLLGKGDCLFHPNGADKATRLQAAFVSDDEVEAVMDHYKNSATPEYVTAAVAELDTETTGGAKGGVFGEGKQEDDLLGEAVRIVLDSGQASISMIQRKLRVGYARAARLVDMMEEKGHVSGFDGSKPRKVLIKRAEFERLYGDGTYLEDADDVETETHDNAEDGYIPEEYRI